MMRAWAAISVAAVLVALPMSVDQAAGSTVAAAATPAMAEGGVVAAAAPSGHLGVMLWLSVAVIAAITAFLVLHHSRTQLAAVPDRSAAVLPFPAGSPSGGPDIAGSPSTGSGG